jgi:hypothetical protein
VPTRPASRSARPRRRAGAALLSLAACLTLAPAAGAQRVLVGFAPGCGPGTGCATARFVVEAPAAGLAFTALALTFTGGPYRFAPSAAGAPLVGTYAAADEFGSFGGFTTLSAGGARLFADFSARGDPANPGVPFTLRGGSTGTFDVEVAPDAAGAFALTYEGTLPGGVTVGGDVVPGAVVPEPAAAAMLAPGALAVAAAARRRRGPRRPAVG